MSLTPFFLICSSVRSNFASIAIWTILSDWQHSGVTHTPWHMTIHEMTGDVPCLQELWEANNQAEFEAVVALKGRDSWRRSASLRDCMDAFMADTWSGIGGFPLRNVTMLDLHIFISGKSIPSTRAAHQPLTRLSSKGSMS